MKKVIGVLVLLAVIGAAALPAVVGPATERQLRQSLTEAAAQQGIGIIDVNVVDYQRSYRSATATINIGLSDDYMKAALADTDDDKEPKTQEEEEELIEMFRNAIPLRLEIEHGPVLTSFAKGVGLNSFRITLDDRDWTAQLRNIMGIDEPFEITGKTGLSGNASFDMNMPAFEVSDKDGRAAFAGLTGGGTWQNSDQHLVMDANSDSFTFALEEEDVEIAMNGIDLDLDTRFLLGSVGVGLSTFNVERVNINASTGELFAFSNLGFDSEAQVSDNNGLVNLRIVYRLEEAVTDTMTLSDATATIELQDIAPGVLEEYQKIVANPVMDTAQIESLTQVFYDALTNSPQLNIGPVKFKVDEETFDGLMTLRIDGNALPDANSFSVMDMSMWLGAITQTLDIRATEGLVNDAVVAYLASQTGEPEELVRQQRAQMLEQLIQQGMITRSANGYAVDVDLNQGEMTVNGNPFPIEALLAP